MLFDLDETLCTGYPYSRSKPLAGAAALLKDLKAEGHWIIIYTARGMSTYSGDLGQILKNIAPLTFEQLDEWGFQYDSIVFGKPAADYYIDDKAVVAGDFDYLRRHIRQSADNG